MKLLTVFFLGLGLNALADGQVIPDFDKSHDVPDDVKIEKILEILDNHPKLSGLEIITRDFDPSEASENWLIAKTLWSKACKFGERQVGDIGCSEEDPGLFEGTYEDYDEFRVILKGRDGRLSELNCGVSTVQHGYTVENGETGYEYELRIGDCQIAPQKSKKKGWFSGLFGSKDWTDIELEDHQESSWVVSEPY